jgi:PAS domain S-box-containing protein
MHTRALTWSLSRTDTAAFAVATTIVALVGVVSFRSIRQLADVDSSVARTLQVLEKMQEIREDLTSAEDAQRGFLLSEDARELKSFEAAVAEIHRDLADVQGLSSAYPEQRQQLAAAEALVDRSLAAFAGLIAVAQSQGFEAARLRARGEAANGAPGQIASLVSAIETSEAGLIEERRRDATQSLRISVGVGAFGTLLAVGLLSLATLRINRDVGRLRRAEQALSAARDQLEERVQQRTAELAQLQRRSQLILDSAGDGICGVDLEGNTTFVNPAALHMLAIPAAELLGGPLHAVHHSPSGESGHQQRACSVCAAALDGRARSFDDVVFWRRDGSSFPVECTSTPMLGEQGQLLGAVVTFMDISERKRSQQDLQEREQLLSETQRIARLGRWEWDVDSDMVRGSEELFRFFDLPRTEVVPGSLFRERIHEDDRARILEGAQLAIRAGQPLRAECRIARPDGSRIRVLINGEIRRTAPGAGQVMVGTLLDVTELREAEDQIRAQAALLDEARDAISARDPAGRILFWNKGAEALYGWSKTEALGRNAPELIPAGEPQLLDEAQRSVLEAGAWTGELKAKTKAGSEIVIESRWTLMRDADGKPTSLLVMDADVTNKKKLEAQLLRAQRMESIGTLAGGIAHDLNNMLAPIVMAVEILRRKLGEDERAARLLATIDTSARRGADMVRQILTFARGIDGERVVMQPRYLLRDAEKIASETFPKDIQVRSEVAAELPNVAGDATQLHQVLLNLCVNARDAMPSGGVLTLGAQRFDVGERHPHPDAKPGAYVQLTVSDTGTGMPPGVLERIFEPFFTTKEVGKGTGLGLSTSIAIVKSHGGFVNVYSEPGKGSVFKVYLPATRGKAEERRVRPAELPTGDGELILVVDDEASIREMAKETLESCGYRVQTAADGAEAVAFYANAVDRIALVVTDMRMPFMDGRATIRALRKINPKVIVIATSGMKDDGIEGAAAAGRLQAFLQKPYSAEELLSNLKRTLGKDASVR